MQEPLKYANDCRRLVGFVIDHVPWLSARTIEDMSESHDKMCEVWKTEFDRHMRTDHFE